MHQAIVDELVVKKYAKDELRQVIAAYAESLICFYHARRRFTQSLWIKGRFREISKMCDTCYFCKNSRITQSVFINVLLRDRNVISRNDRLYLSYSVTLLLKTS